MERKNILLIVTLIFILNLSFLSAEEFGYNLIKPDAFNNNTAFVNSSAYWDTGDRGPLRNVADINHNWLSNLLWSTAGHVMDTVLDMNGNDIIMDNAAIQNPNYIQFNTTWEDGSAEGRLQWNAEDGTLEVGMPGGNVNLQMGQENLRRVMANETMNMGTVVYSCGSTGSRLIVCPTDWDSFFTSLPIGILTENITENQFGFINAFGLNRDIDTTGEFNNCVAGSTFNSIAWLSNDGQFTCTTPPAEKFRTVVGVIIKANAESGILDTSVDIVPDIPSLSYVNGTGLTNLSILQYDNGSLTWKMVAGPLFSNIYSKDEVDELVGGDLELYFKNDSSGISTYRVMNKSSNGAPKNSTSQTISATNTHIGAFISANASDLGISGLDAGIIDAHFHANVDLVTGKKNVEGWFQIFIRNSTGQEELIGSSHLVPVESTDEDEYEAHAQILEDIELNSSDRIVIKLIANLSGSGGNPVLTTYIQGNTLSRAVFGTLGVNFLTVGQADKTYVPYLGAISNTDLGAFNITTNGNIEAGSFILNNTEIFDWDEIGSNVSINFGANESDTSGPAIPFLLTEKGVLKIEAIDSGSGSTIWEQVLSEIRNVVGNVFNFTGTGFFSDNVEITGNLTVSDSLVWGGGYITSNATCSYLRYNATGVLKESDCP